MVGRGIYNRRYAAVSVFIVLSVFYATMGDKISDWGGYRSLYLSDGGWLRDYGRDRVFVWILSATSRLLGHNGYIYFRAFLFVLLALLASWCTSQIPPLRKFNHLQLLVVIFESTAIFFPKTLIEVREGLSFFLILASGIALGNSPSRYRVAIFAIASLLAIGIHLGSMSILVTFLAALAIRPHFDPRDKLFQLLLLMAGAASGCLIAVTMSILPHAVGEILVGFNYGSNSNTNITPGTFVRKISIGLPLLALILRQNYINYSDEKSLMSCVEIFSGLFMLPLLGVVLFYGLFFPYMTSAVYIMGVRLIFTMASLNIFSKIYLGRRDFFIIFVCLDYWLVFIPGF